MPYAEIIACDYELGGRILTNRMLIEDYGLGADPQAAVSEEVEKIRERTGIYERHICDADQNAITLAVSAGQRTLEQGEVDPRDVDMLILATTTSEQQVPSMASTVQDKLGLKNAAAFDLNAACAGSGYGLDIADALIKSGRYGCVMLAGADRLSGITDWTDRATAMLFADAAGTLVIKATEERDCGLLGSALVSRGEDRDILYCDLNGKIKMKGGEVFRRAVRLMPEIGEVALKRSGLDISEVRLLVPHQANARITDAGARALGFEDGAKDKRVANYIEDMGNSSAATMIIGLARALEEKRVAKDDIVLFDTFGAGMAGAAIAWRL